MFFWKKKQSPEIPPAISYDHHRICVEKGGETKVLSPKQFEQEFAVRYNPRLDFCARRDFFTIYRKAARDREKGILSARQLWLGTYFQQELDAPAVPPVRLRWIDDALGWGVFAERDLSPMTYIGEYAGQVRRKKRADRRNAYCFQYAIADGEATSYTIDAFAQGGIVRFINHSESANLMSALAIHQNIPHIVLFVSRKVLKGQQLCFDYGSDYWKKRPKPRQLGG